MLLSIFMTVLLGKFDILLIESIEPPQYLHLHKDENDQKQSCERSFKSYEILPTRTSETVQAQIKHKMLIRVLSKPRSWTSLP